MTCPACNIDLEGYPVKTYTKPTGEICCCNCKFILNKKEIDEKYKHLHILEAMSEELFEECDEVRSNGRQISKHDTRE
jgi:transcription initiation factor TFIIIB Brf1 subunit/transcription initiation factor TFIIB